MKKILFVTQTLNKGGAERVISLLSKEFESLGFKVSIILFDNKIQYEYGGKIINIKTPSTSLYFIKLIRLLQRIFRLKKIFIYEKPDYIFSFTESCNFACILTGEKVIVSIRNNPNIKHLWYQKILIKYLYKFSNVRKIVAVSQEVKNILDADYNLKNTITIFNPIIIDESTEIQQKLTCIQPFILAVGRLTKQKNFEMLIKAFSNTDAKNYANLLIVGHGELRQKLEQLVYDLCLEDKVFLVGLKDNIRDYYLQCDCFVLSSSFEGFPNVLIEALANKCCCIATNCPTGPNEIIKNEINGLLISNNNQSETTRNIDKLFFNTELKKTFKRNAYISIQHLNIKIIAKQWLNI